MPLCALQVYKATDLEFDTHVAIKQFRPGTASAVIENEVSLLKRCQNEHINTFYGAYLKDDRVWLILGYCAGSVVDVMKVFKSGLAEPEIKVVANQSLKVSCCATHHHLPLHDSRTGDSCNNVP